MTSPFRQLHHICLVVHDIDAATRYYEGLGIGPWQDYPPLSQYTDLEVPDPEAFGALKYRFADLDNVQIQLCQPPRLDCPQRRFLDTRGEGVFQIGFEANLDTATAQGRAAGLDVLMAGRRDNRTGFVYFDTLDQTGVAWMCRQTKPVLVGPRGRCERADTGAMTETETLIAEVRQLRADVARLHAAHTVVHIRHAWLKPLFKDLSTNPYTQYKVHMWGAIYWLINFPLVCFLFFFTPTLWLKLGIFITLIYSIYANLATDYGAMSAAEAAFGEPQGPPIPLEPQPPLPSI